MSAGGMGGQAQPMGGGKGGMGMTQGPAAGGKGGMGMNRGPGGNAQNNPGGYYGGPRPFGPGSFRPSMNVFPGNTTGQRPQSLPPPAFLPDQGLSWGGGPMPMANMTPPTPQPQTTASGLPAGGLLAKLYGG